MNNTTGSMLLIVVGVIVFAGCPASSEPGSDSAGAAEKATSETAPHTGVFTDGDYEGLKDNAAANGQ